MNTPDTINYVELAAADMEATEAFFAQCFGWTFTHYGPDYMDCPDGGLMIGFYRAQLTSRPEAGGALVTFYSDHLEDTLSNVEASGGVIVKPTFSFPGGRRFQFTEPSGNEFAVWSDREAVSE